MEPFLVSTVIVTWNRKDDVAAAVQSTYDQTYPDVEVIVDNGSTDGTVAALPETTPARRSSVIALDRNLGASGGRQALSS